LRVVTFNVEFDNPETGPLRRFLEQSRPDILVLEEATPQWRSALRAWGDLYPYTTLTDQGRDITLVIASRHPILATRRMLGNSRPSRSFDRTYIVRAAIDVDGRPLVVYAVHPPSPRRALLWPRRNLYLATLAEQFQRFPGDTPVLMAGDFNTAPWSPFFARLLERTGLLPAARSRWPAPTRVFKDLHLPAWLGVPVDHILVSPGIAVRAYGPGPDLGSDHLPVMADLVLPAG
jgi:endonuclease/exonuclease/phosphatase (EEP) superfamily protein YafD